MAKGYWIVRVSVRNAEKYPDYLKAAKPAFEAHKAKFLVRGGDFELKEGQARDRNVVVEFPDVETATACYVSDAYQAARQIRIANADADFLIVEGAA
ncbi:MAG: DUF1330 domain-containing protein [Silicimonas sp.]|nr:DUF1330 domain-containing protein [Silicimonas sp.]